MTYGKKKGLEAGEVQSRPTPQIYSPIDGLGVSSRSLDFLRGAAAVYVLIGHARGHLFAGGARRIAEGGVQWYDYLALALLQLTSLGTEAVILFFVLSGFAMAHSVAHSTSKWNFYKKRIVRIWPPYLAALAAAYACAEVIIHSPVANPVTQMVGGSDWSLVSALRRAFYIDVNTELTGQFWSLPFEVIFYLVCPLLLVSKVRATIGWAFSVVSCVLTVLLFGIFDDPTVMGGSVVRAFPSFLIFFMCGAMAYYYPQIVPRCSGRRLLWIFFASFAFIWFVKYRVFGGWNIITSLLYIPISMLLIFNVPPAISERRWLNWGHFSYSLYIIHIQIIMMISYLLARYFDIRQQDMASYWMWALSVPPILLGSYLFFELIEKRCNAYLARIRDKERIASYRGLQSV